MNEQTCRQNPSKDPSSNASRQVAPPEVTQQLLVIAEQIRRIAADNPTIACEITAAARLIEIKLMNGSVGLVSLHQAAMRALDRIG